MAINYSKYEYTGWGISESGLKALESLIYEHGIERVLEFGSGQSTYFLQDLGVKYVSFDDDHKYTANTGKVLVRPLKQLSDSDFLKIVIQGEDYYKTIIKAPPVQKKSPRQKNCFYEIEKKDLKGKYDLVILDGPNGNGRSIAFNLIKPYLKKKSYIFIDDFDHYPFIEHLKIVFPKAVLLISHLSGKDRYQIYKIELE